MTIYTGTTNAETLTGASTDDTLIGNGGADTLIGGAGNDTYVVTSGTEVITELTNQGLDTVRSGVSTQLGANLENLELTGSNPTNGTGNDLNNVLTGNASNNTLTGGLGDDTLISNGGADKLIGGSGNDIYVVTSGTEVISELADQGIDTVRSGVSAQLGANLENLILTGSNPISGTGNDYDNVLMGNASNNTLIGGLGNDTLISGGGFDTLLGGEGDDTYVISNDLSNIQDTAGTDTLVASVTVHNTSGLEVVQLTDADNIDAFGSDQQEILFGNAGVNTLWGNAGNDLLVGGGNDELRGGLGDDTYELTVQGDTIIEAGGEGNDTIRATITVDLRDNVERLSLIGGADIDGYGNALANEIYGNSGVNTLVGGDGNDTICGNDGDDVLDGGNGNDTLYGELGVDTLRGGAGDDVLNGGADNDTLIGGLGNDSYILSGPRDLVLEDVNGGVDTVVLAENLTLAANIENGMLGGTAGFTLQGNELGNVLAGNTGDNRILGMAGDDGLAGGAGNDMLLGGDGRDTLFGDEGNDTLSGEAGIDKLAGGAGDDLYIITDQEDVLIEEASQGTDTVRATNTSFALGDNFENLTLLGQGVLTGAGNSLNNTLIASSVMGSVVLRGMAGDDLLRGSGGADTLDGGEGIDTMSGGAGADTYYVDNIADVVTDAPDDTATDTVFSTVNVTLSAGIENLTLTGSAAASGTGNDLANSLIGNNSVNTLIGGAGNDVYMAGDGNDILIDSTNPTVGSGDDTLNGGGGADTMSGGTGNDLYFVDASGDTVIEGLGEGTDSVQSSVSYTLAANVENLTLTGVAGNGAGNDIGNTLMGNDQSNLLNGLGGNDVLLGGAGDDVLRGGTGDDTLVGGEGADTLDGSLGLDVMRGGTGNDFYVLNDTLVDPQAQVTELANEGIDTLQTGVQSLRLAANIENALLTGKTVQVVYGNELNNKIIGNDVGNTLVGGEGSDTLIGGSGNDVLKGGTGANNMDGGAGNDIYYVDGVQDVITENASSGTDIVVSSVRHVLSAFVENLTLVGSTGLVGTGNDIANGILGSDGNDTLSGLGGNDIIRGGLGDDAIMGGTGDDQLSGEAGNDVLDGGSGVDTLNGGVGNDTYVVDSAEDLIIESANNGTDSVRSAVSYVLANNLENLTIFGSAVSATGNAVDNILVGNLSNNVLTGLAGNDTLDGAGGTDTLIGGVGNDTYLISNVGVTVTEAANEGTDTVRSAISYTLGDNIENLSLIGSAVTAVGNAAANQLVGNAGNNIMQGGDGNDVLLGQAGNDTLDGGAGMDTLNGGAGDDVYYVDASDLVVEGANPDNATTTPDTGGIDTVVTAATRKLDANVENMTLVGTGNVNAFGNDLANTLVGNDGNNTLYGGGGADTMAGGKGDDTYLVTDTGSVVIEAFGAGTDTLRSQVNYVLGDNASVETLIADQSSAMLTLVGNKSDNVLLAYSSAVLSGGAGNDTLLGSMSSDTLDGGIGNDTLTGSAGDTLMGGLGDDTFYVLGESVSVVEAAQGGSDTVVTSINLTLADNVETLVLQGARQATGNGLANTIRVEASSSQAISGVIIDGAGGNDTISGASLADTLLGGAGFDTLDGKGGADTLIGGLDGDVYLINDAAVTVIESAGEGYDVIRSTVSYTLAANVDAIALLGDAKINAKGNELANSLIGNGADNTLDGGAGADVMAGGLGSDTYLVSDSADVVSELFNQGNDTVLTAASYRLTENIETLVLLEPAAVPGTTSAVISGAVTGTGNSLANTIIGNSLGNTLDGGLNADTLRGGLGNDTYVVDNVGDIVTEDVSAGSDRVISSVTHTLTANVEALTLVGSALINGYGNQLDNTLVGNGYANTLDGGAGNDTLVGGGGLDTLIGGAGNDTYQIGSGLEKIVEAAASGVDTVVSMASVTLGENLENLTLIGTAALSGYGNAANNQLLGNSAANTLNGGAGADFMLGGMGNDTYVVDNANDRILETANAGADTVQAYLSWTLGDNFETLMLMGTEALNGKGNAGNNTILGNAGANTLAGGGGIDLLKGGAGDDTYLVDALTTAVVENANDGSDTIVSSLTAFALGYNLENLVLTGNALTATGNTLDNKLVGNGANNSLYGNAGADQLFGGAGNDTLDGGLGADTLSGGAGNDLLKVDNVGDRVLELADEGVDTVVSTVSHTLAANVENLTLIGGNLDGTGNTLDNTITGSRGNNTLTGGGGNDTLLGLGGNDTYMVGLGSGQVTIVETLNGGIDSVLAIADYSLGANVENLTLLGSARIGTGNELGNMLIGTEAANTLYGLAGNDTLMGGLGADTLVGGLGNDTYFVDNQGDVLSEQLNEGMDTVLSSVTLKLAANLEYLTLLGADSLSAYGNDLANVLTGNAGNNYLDGGLGGDAMIGGAGNDTYVVDNSSDGVKEAYGAGSDTILSSVTYKLSDYVEILQLTGSAAINGLGNAGDNTLIGNSANNTLAGNMGNDTYVYALGSGNDTFQESGGTDTLKVLSGNLSIAELLSDMTFKRVGTDLVIDIAVPGTVANTLTIKSVGYASNVVETLELTSATGQTQEIDLTSIYALTNTTAQHFGLGDTVTDYGSVGMLKV